MDGDDFTADPFSSDGLWQLSRFTLQSLQPLDAVPWDEGLPDLAAGAFKPSLDLLDGNGPELHKLEILDPEFTDSDEPSVLTIDDSNHGHYDAETEPHIEEESDNIWTLENLNAASDETDVLKSWERYQDRGSQEPVSAYFSESGARGFDAALARQAATNNLPGSRNRIVRNEHFFRSLFRLGLGWNSMFFRYDQQQGKFVQVCSDVRISGISPPALNGLTDEMLQCGTDMQRVRKFITETPTKTNEPSALTTFSSAASVIIYTLETKLVHIYKDAVSLIRIRSLFAQCGELVGALANIIESVKGAVSESEIISIILAKAAHFSQTFGYMENLFRDIAARIIRPFLAHVETWVGLRTESSTLQELARSERTFVSFQVREENTKTSKPDAIDYIYLPEQMPSFIPADQANVIFESGRSLRLLKRFHPQHPIASEKICHSDHLKLGCASTWADIARIQTKAQQYEQELRAEILRYNRDGPTIKESTSQALEQPVLDDGNNSLSGAFDLFDINDKNNMTGLLTNQASLKNDALGQLLETARRSYSEELTDHENHFAPELASSLYLSIAPFLASQASLIDFSCIHLLFKEHKLRYHLTLQWRFQLLGDGFFASRLSHSLFDPEMESGERKSGVVRSGVHTGLRLGSRDTWPPASSELRLVLIGLLDECYNHTDNRNDLVTNNDGEAGFRREKELPGGLSFSIRDLTDEETARCKDPDAIEALDFLRLQYKPSDVLGVIITPRSLAKYDRLFKHLLRLLRMVSVAKGLIRDSTVRGSLSGDHRNVFQKFRIESQHFILAMSDYCFHVGVGSTWQRFQETLGKIESCLERGDFEGTIDAAHSVPQLREYHDAVLDQMLLALFLSKRHADATKLLASIFGTILTFAPLSRIDGMRGVRHESETTVNRLYALFRKQTAAFVGYLRGLGGARASSSKSSARFGMESPAHTTTAVFDHLLSRLDMKRYY